MDIAINNSIIQNMSTTRIIIFAIVGYIIGIALYYNIQQRPTLAKVIVTDTKWLGTVTRAQHIVLFMFIGYFLPHRFILVMFLGMGWEGVEYVARHYFRNKWWGDGTDYLKDIFANTSGFLIGYLLHMGSANL